MDKQNNMQSGDAQNPTDPYAREAQIFPKLTQEQVARMCVYGVAEALDAGTVLFEPGDRTVDFFIVLKGHIDIYEHSREGEKILTRHGERQFTGELDLFNNRQILVGGRMGDDGEVIRIGRDKFKKMLSAESDIGEIIVRAFILRRVGLISHEQGSVTLLCARQSSDTMRIERFLRRNGYPLQILDDPDDAERAALLEKYAIDAADLPSVYIHFGERVLNNPSTYALAEALGLVEQPDRDHVYDVAIVGAGPAGLSAAVYAASEGLSTLLLESEAPGGQAGTSSKIENYLGFPTGISGQALSGRAQVQAQKFGATIALPHNVKALDCAEHPFTLRLCDQSRVRAKSVVVTTGASYRTLNLDNGRQFDNAGIYYAATAMEAGLCSGEEIIVVGGGNSAGQAAVFLSQYAKHVHILVRRDGLAETMSDYLVERIESSKHITLHTHTQITGLQGNTNLEGVTWHNSKEDKESTHAIRHVFLMIGAVPNSDWLQACLQLDEHGFVLTGLDVSQCPRWSRPRRPMMLETSVPGIFAAGDIRSGSIKRVASGVGEGSMTISHVHQFLTELVVEEEPEREVA